MKFGETHFSLSIQLGKLVLAPGREEKWVGGRPAGRLLGKEWN